MDGLKWMLGAKREEEEERGFDRVKKFGCHRSCRI
jgi:hypothetical protein